MLVQSILPLIAFSVSLAANVATDDVPNTTNRQDLDYCTVKSAKTVSFRYVDKYADTRRGECISITGYIYGQTLHQTMGVAAGDQEPDWRSIGLDLDWEKNTLPIPNHPIRYTVIGNMRDCGNASFPNYCHYVGGSIIAVTNIRINKRKRP